MRNDPRLTLRQLNLLVRGTIEAALPDEYWVEAELSECRERGGHCYMELVEKDPDTNTPVARAQAKCWRQTWQMVQPHFERATGQPLRAGLKVLLRVYAQFHEAYGFSWIVTDIDPTYTLGDMARRRQEIIRQLKEEGVFDLQRELCLPLFCQHIAVISAAGAAGYGDFTRQLEENPYGLRLTTTLFPATMQGEQVEPSVIKALNDIYEASAETPFDAVVIIRGGGATADLSGFDTLALAENVAQFPLPIITGIGHDRDESVLDMVSHTRVKTPTAAAAFLIEHLKTVLDDIDSSQERIATLAQQRLTTLHHRLTLVSEAIPRLFSVVKTRQEARVDALFNRFLTLIQQRTTGHRSLIDRLEQRMPLLLERRLTQERHRLEIAGERVKNLDPDLLLRRGYSITLKDGKAVRDPALLKPGDELVTRMEKGSVTSVVS